MRRRKGCAPLGPRKLPLVWLVLLRRAVHPRPLRRLLPSPRARVARTRRPVLRKSAKHSSEERRQIWRAKTCRGVPGRSDARRACSASPVKGCPAESTAAARGRSADPAPTAASDGLSSRSQRARRAAWRPGGRRSRGRLSGIDGACRRAPCRRRNPDRCTGAPRASPAAATTTLSANPPTVLVVAGQILRTSRGLDLGSSGGSLGSLLYPVWLRTRQARSRCDVPDGSCSYEPSGAIFVPGGGAEQTRKHSVSSQHKREHCGGRGERTEVLYRDVMSHILRLRLGARHVRHVQALLPSREGLRQHRRLVGRHERAVRWWLVLLRRGWSPAQRSERDRQRHGAAGRPPIQTHPRRCVRPWEEAEEGGGGRGGCGTWLGAFSAQGLCSVFSRASGPEKSAGEPSGEALRGVRNSGTNPRGEGTRPVRPRGVSVGLPQ